MKRPPGARNLYIPYDTLFVPYQEGGDEILCHVCRSTAHYDSDTIMILQLTTVCASLLVQSSASTPCTPRSLISWFPPSARRTLFSMASTFAPSSWTNLSAGDVLPKTSRSSDSNRRRSVASASCCRGNADTCPQTSITPKLRSNQIYTYDVQQYRKYCEVLSLRKSDPQRLSI